MRSFFEALAAMRRALASGKGKGWSVIPIFTEDLEVVVTDREGDGIPLPFFGLNGSHKKTLQEEVSQIVITLVEAGASLSQIAPHPRDYTKPGDWEIARDFHMRQVFKIESARTEIVRLWARIDERDASLLPPAPVLPKWHGKPYVIVNREGWFVSNLSPVDGRPVLVDNVKMAQFYESSETAGEALEQFRARSKGCKFRIVTHNIGGASEHGS